MKFPKYKSKNRKTLKIADFTALNSHNDFILKSVNTELYGGAIKTRRAVVATGESLATVESSASQSFSFTGAVQGITGGLRELTYLLTEGEDFSYTYTFRFFGSDGSVQSAGKIEYLRGDGRPARRPENIVCFTAKPKYGCGVYAYIKVAELNSGEYTLEIHELSEDLALWHKISENEFYIPTYYVNGQGNNSYLSEQPLPEPKYSEPLNLLSGICECRYTTDGFSNSFELPVAYADINKDSYLVAEIKADRTTTLTFTINRHSAVSNSVSYLGREIQMVYTGDGVYFTSGSEPYAFARYSSKNNNLKIRVKHRTEEETNWLMNVHAIFSHSFMQGGNRLVLANNIQNSTLIAVSEEDNPFYFPVNNQINIGFGGKINAVSVGGDDMLIFKNAEIYRLKFSSGKLRTEKINSEISAANQRSVKSMAGITCFIGTDSKPYACIGSKVYYLGKPIEWALGRLDSLEEAVACTAFNKYVVLCKKSALVLDLSRGEESLKSPSWCVWDFPFNSHFVGCISHCEDFAIVGRSYVTGIAYYYIARLAEGTGDMCYPYSSVRFEQQLTSINAEIKTNYLALAKNGLFSLDMLDLFVNMNGQGSVRIADQSGDIKWQGNININVTGSRAAAVRLMPLVTASECSLEFSSESPLAFSGAALKYRVLSE